MTPDQFIDKVITNVLRLPLLDGDNAGWRALALDWVQEVWERIYNGKGWPFRRGVVDPFTLSAGVKTVPSDFLAVGEMRRGGLWVKSTGQRLIPVGEEVMRDMLLTPGGASSGDPTHYSVYGVNTTDGTLNVNCNTTADTQLVLAYEKGAGTLTDSDTDTNLAVLPTGLHMSAVWPAVRAYARHQHGDSDVDPEQAIKNAIGIIARAMRPDADTPKQTPSFFGDYL